MNIHQPPKSFMPLAIGGGIGLFVVLSIMMAPVIEQEPEVVVAPLPVVEARQVATSPQPTRSVTVQQKVDEPPQVPVETTQHPPATITKIQPPKNKPKVGSKNTHKYHHQPRRRLFQRLR